MRNHDEISAIYQLNGIFHVQETFHQYMNKRDASNQLETDYRDLGTASP